MGDSSAESSINARRSNGVFCSKDSVTYGNWIVLLITSVSNIFTYAVKSLTFMHNSHMV